MSQINMLKISMQNMKFELQKLQSFDYIFETYYDFRLNITQ